MKIGEVFRLAHRELVAYRTRSRATVITVGVLFGLLLAVLLVVQGLENVVLRYVASLTAELGGGVYIVTEYENSELVLERVRKYGGEVLTDVETMRMRDGAEVSEGVVIARFENVAEAERYYSKADAKEMKYNARDYEVSEIFSNQVGVYRYFREKNEKLVGPASVTLMIVAALILALTMAHLIAGSTKTFVLYRAVGASKGQLLMIYFVYLLELCFRAAVFAVGMAVILAGVAMAAGWNYFLEQLGAIYPSAPEIWPVLVGVNLQCVLVIMGMFVTAPVAFLLCLDQFSDKKLAQKLKGD